MSDTRQVVVGSGLAGYTVALTAPSASAFA